MGRGFAERRAAVVRLLEGATTEGEASAARAALERMDARAAREELPSSDPRPHVADLEVVLRCVLDPRRLVRNRRTEELRWVSDRDLTLARDPVEAWERGSVDRGLQLGGENGA